MIFQIKKTIIRGSFLFLSLTIQQVYADLISGVVNIVNDGDTFEIWNQSIRLQGIDAPEYSQQCKNNKGRSYSCGGFSLNYLKELVRGNEVICEGEEKDQYGRLLATCKIGETNINQQMVSAGWALAYTRYDDRYIQQQAQAKKAGRGMWQGEFINPEAFRAATWKKAEKLADQQGSDCVIKGNINTEGDRIYHTPWGSKHYKRTKISKRHGERWFCTEAEALAAGWRAPNR